MQDDIGKVPSKMRRRKYQIIFGSTLRTMLRRNESTETAAGLGQSRRSPNVRFEGKADVVVRPRDAMGH